MKLWTVYKIWNVYNGNTQTPVSQAEQNDVSYVYTLTFPTDPVSGDVIGGIYELILIAAPISKNYSQYFNDPFLSDTAAQVQGWYRASVGVMVDPIVTNCLNRKRYEFLQGIMCGICDRDYLLFYSDYVGMLAAMEAQDWPTAIALYNKLKTQCSGDSNSSCGC